MCTEHGVPYRSSYQCQCLVSCSSVCSFCSFCCFETLCWKQIREGMVGFDEAHCPFGSQCFRKFTKLKSRAVLRIIRTGYSVLWSDVDIVWYKDPLPDLVSYGPGTFPVQSNEPKSELPGTGIRRINSGFYLVRSDPLTIEAFEAITAHAATTRLSEQPSFYDVLCGLRGKEWYRGKRSVCGSMASALSS